MQNAQVRCKMQRLEGLSGLTVSLQVDALQPITSPIEFALRVQQTNASRREKGAG
jgi:hypothetical protein